MVHAMRAWLVCLMPAMLLIPSVGDAAVLAPRTEQAVFPLAIAGAGNRQAFFWTAKSNRIDGRFVTAGGARGPVMRIAADGHGDTLVGAVSMPDAGVAVLYEVGGPHHRLVLARISPGGSISRTTVARRMGYPGALLVGGDGLATVVTQTPTFDLAVHQETSRGSFAAPAMIDLPEGDVEDIAVRVDGAGQTWVAWSGRFGDIDDPASFDQLLVQTTYRPPGGTFAPVRTIGRGYRPRPGLWTQADGRVRLTWTGDRGVLSAIAGTDGAIGRPTVLLRLPVSAADAIYTEDRRGRAAVVDHERRGIVVRDLASPGRSRRISRSSNPPLACFSPAGALDVTWLSGDSLRWRRVRIG
jgi:hypothetical protein